MMAKIKLIGLILLGIVILAVVFFQLKEIWSIKTRIMGLGQKAVTIEQENELLEKDIAYWADPVNIEKELRKKGFKRSDEQMILVVSPKESTDSSEKAPQNNKLLDFFKNLFK